MRFFARQKNKGQASVEYILLIGLFVTIVFKFIGVAQDIFYGWESDGLGGKGGAIQLIMENQAKRFENNIGWE